jgi:hypothetical protein
MFSSRSPSPSIRKAPNRLRPRANKLTSFLPSVRTGDFQPLRRNCGRCWRRVNLEPCFTWKAIFHPRPPPNGREAIGERTALKARRAGWRGLAST